MSQHRGLAAFGGDRGEYVAKNSKLYVEGKMSRGGAPINILKTYIEQPKTPP